MADLPAAFQKLIDLSGIMLRKAQEGTWEEVIALEAKRDKLIRKFFSEPVPEEIAGGVAEGIHAILAIDQKIIELGAVMRFDLLRTLQEMEQGKKAVKAYTS